MSAVATSTVRSTIAMDTAISVEALGDVDPAQLERALGWFHEVETHCTRFDAVSELSRLCARPGVSVVVSDLLFRAVEFALAVAEESSGAFDPTIGGALQRRGFDRNYRTGGQIAAAAADPAATFRDVYLDPASHAITLLRPLSLDLGAVAKGLAIDLAAAELAGLTNFAISAGGDLRLAGHNADGAPWQVGIRNPAAPTELMTVLSISDAAVCTSAGNERPAPDGGNHITDPATGESPASALSVTVVAPTAMVADAFATAAFVLGPRAGLAFLERNGAEGLIATPTLDIHTTSGFARFLA